MSKRASEDRISDAARAGRISRLREWWERKWCRHSDESTRDRTVKWTDGIDAAEITEHWCPRCGAWWRRGEFSYERYTAEMAPKAVRND